MSKTANNHRNRSEGWRHAKISGHSNEALLDELLKKDKRVQKRFLSKVDENAKIVDCIYGGLNEKSVACVLGGKTKNKTDMMVTLDNGISVGVSIKKSFAGQVGIITTKRFVEGMEAQYGIKVPKNVVRGIELFWGTAGDAQDIAKKFGDKKYRKYEIKYHRLTADTLKRYNPKIAQALVNWFKDNIYDITDFCFSRGLAKHSVNFSSIVWYKNMLKENDLDMIFHIDELCEKCKQNKDKIDFGTRGGGTTIQLPFGFVEFHQDQMQFHHKYKKIEALLASASPEL